MAELLPMRRISRRLVLAALVSGVVVVAAAGSLLLLGEAPPPVAPAPESSRQSDLAAFAFNDATGRIRSLAEFRGKALVLNLWATWCVPCREEMPTLDRLQAKLGGPDFEVLAVSLDRKSAEHVAAFLAEIGTKHLTVYLADITAVRRAIGVFGLPTTLFVDREGREVHRVVGPAEWNSAAMIASIRERLDLPADAREGSPTP
jgi:thiol-disulfide isomerase/thioredoxin